MSLPIFSNPISETIPLSDFGISLARIVQIPNSGTNNGQPPRLNFVQTPSDGSNRIFVNDMRGKLYVIENEVVREYLDLKSTIRSDFLDTGGQQGFISFVFDPNFKNNGIFYTVHTELKGTKTPDFPVLKPIINSQGNIIASSHHDVLTQWIAQDPSANSFTGNQREILRIEQPYADHNLGEIAFNPNALPGSEDYGLLYIAAADGGSNSFPVSNTDPLNNGQDLSVPLGKILRIDPNGNNSTNGKYGIPLDNPFASDNNPNTLGEIWAYGLRNPHRFSWDTGGDQKLLVVDIGQGFIEEVNLGIKGANYGWGNREGTFVIDAKNERVLYPLPLDDSLNNYTYPVAQYDHDLSTNVAIVGGFVYRGRDIPALNGQYIFADFATDGRFFTVNADNLINGQQTPLAELRIIEAGATRNFLGILGKSRSDVRFGTDETGEIYVINKQDGWIRKMIPAAPTIDDIFFAYSNSQIFDGKTGFDQVIYQDLNRKITLTATNRVIKQGTFGTNPPTSIDQLISIEQIEGNSNQVNTIDASDAGDRRIRVDLGSNQFWLLEATTPDTIMQTFTVLNFRNVVGSAQNDVITGNGLDNRLEGRQGDDRLDGGLGRDTLIGGDGNDWYRVENSGDKVMENSNGGIDLIQSLVSYTLPAFVENLELMGTGNHNGTGNELNNQIMGNSGNNLLDGRGGADNLRGGLGNDTYVVDNSGDILSENPNEGTDTVNASISFVLADNFENLTLTGSSNLNGTGNTLANRLIGNSGINTLIGGEGNDSLDGRGGADILIGGKGNDTYIVDNSGDILSENPNEGTDTVNASISFVLADNFENLTLTGSSNLNGTGNTLANRLIGNSGINTLIGGEGNDSLDGRGGADILIGGRGNDTLNLGLNDGQVDRVQYGTGDGTDTVNHFVKGIDQLSFTDVAFVDVVVSRNNILLRLGNGVAGDAGFGSGQVLLNLWGVIGFTEAHLGVNGSSLGEANIARFFFT